MHVIIAMHVILQLLTSVMSSPVRGHGAKKTLNPKTLSPKTQPASEPTTLNHKNQPALGVATMRKTDERTDQACK